LSTPLKLGPAKELIMPAIPPWSRRVARSLAARLDRLRETFDHFYQQLRDALAQSIGRAVADAVRDAVYHLLDTDPPRYAAPSWRRPEEDSPWEEDRDPWDDGPRTWHQTRASFHEERDDPPAEVPSDQNFRRAALAGLEAAAWWLRLRRGRRVLLGALALGGLAFVASYFGGPVVAAAVAVAVSAAALLALLRGARAVADPFDTSR
jgi:hypothetical protein